MLPNQSQPVILHKNFFYRGRKCNFEVNQLRLLNGVEIIGEYLRYPGGALAIPVTKEGKLVLLKQYRYTVAKTLLEFPAGTSEPEEEPLETIKREIEEETGYRAHYWQFLGKFPLAPSYSDEYVHVFLAQDLEKLKQPPPQDKDEMIEVVLLSPQELATAILSGEPINAEAIASFFLARPYLNCN
jgi:ADP-ribose pyrophosphatase